MIQVILFGIKLQLKEVGQHILAMFQQLMLSLILMLELLKTFLKSITHTLNNFLHSIPIGILLFMIQVLSGIAYFPQMHSVRLVQMLYIHLIICHIVQLNQVHITGELTHGIIPKMKLVGIRQTRNLLHIIWTLVTSSMNNISLCLKHYLMTKRLRLLTALKRF